MSGSKIISIIIVALCVRTATAQSLDSTSSANKEIVFVSDTQGPIWLETFWWKSDNNRYATQRIFDDIEKQQPKAVVILGDVVSKGFSERQWKLMDNYLQPLRSKGTKVSAILGNHDVLWFHRKGEQKFQQRFPDHIKTGYVQVIDSVAIVLLNSNFNALTEGEEKLEEEWYKETLQKLDNDSAIQFIITGCHHSPYSNSKGEGFSKEVQEKFAKWFLTSKKSRLFLSGHTHSFEHFQVEGKDFMVIGGGGGLYQQLKKTNRINDLQAAYKPMFHYLTVKRIADKLQVKSIELAPNFRQFDEGLALNISLNGTSSEASVAKETTAGASTK